MTLLPLIFRLDNVNCFVFALVGVVAVFKTPFEKYLIIVFLLLEKPLTQIAACSSVRTIVVIVIVVVAVVISDHIHITLTVKVKRIFDLGVRTHLLLSSKLLFQINL